MRALIATAFAIALALALLSLARAGDAPTRPLSLYAGGKLIAHFDAWSGPVRGNRVSRIYEWPACPNYNKIAQRHRVEFPSAKAAEKAGYRAARNCH